jgi:hypothetical protein
MKTFSALLVAAGLLGGCVTHGTVAQAPPPTNVYRGEVWNWDPVLNTVTLRQGAQDVRVKVTPDQLDGLRLHDIATVRGELAPPAEIERTVVQGPPMRAVATGPMDQTEVTGTITAIDPNGKVSLATSRGPLDVWVATPVGDRFQVGAPVRMKGVIQSVTLVPLDAGASGQTEPAALAATEPGDYAVVTGRIIALEPSGRITIESPRGPVSAWVAEPSRYRAGQVVQLRTSLAPGQ